MKPHTAAQSTGSPELDIVVGVVRQALQDARHGDSKAAMWLYTFVGDRADDLGIQPPSVIQGSLWGDEGA